MPRLYPKGLLKARDDDCIGSLVAPKQPKEGSIEVEKPPQMVRIRRMSGAWRTQTPGAGGAAAIDLVHRELGFSR